MRKQRRIADNIVKYLFKYVLKYTNVWKNILKIIFVYRIRIIRYELQTLVIDQFIALYYALNMHFISILWCFDH